MKNGHANLQLPVVEMNAIVLMSLPGYQQWNGAGWEFTRTFSTLLQLSGL
jgi:hypothetical protein